MNLVIDVGNTRVKLAVFEGDTVLFSTVFDKKIILSELKKIIKKYKISSGIMSSVASLSKSKMEKIQKLLKITLISSNTKVPFINLYKTPTTLGVDRIALVTGAALKYPKQNVLVIDAGTCITFDFINSKSQYLGGAISPGINLRYRALHEFTAKLPLLEKKEINFLIGQTTEQSIHSGVVNGVARELDGIILDYLEKYTDLTIVLTGGDTNFLSKQLKSSIFANQNFLLQGLNKLLIFNKDK